MSLFNQWRKKRFFNTATAITAITATEKAESPAKIATIAKIAIATAKITENQLARKGISQEQIEHLGHVLRVRDADSDFDDRISCAECQSFYLMQDVMHCKQGKRPAGHSYAYTLHRCTSFMRG